MIFNHLSSSETKDIRKLLKRGSLLIAPFLLIQTMEVFVAPSEWFTFRIWEAILAGTYRYPGPFQPNTHIKKEKEYGIMYRYGIVNSKKTEWFTDAYGWRNRPEVERSPKYDVVVIGDSNIAGSFLDQKDTLSEVISRRANCIAYSYAYTQLNGLPFFFSDTRPVLKTAKLLVVETQPTTWATNVYSLAAFHTLPDGTIDLYDHEGYKNRHEGNVREINYHKISKLRYFRERAKIKFNYQYLWHNLRANLHIDFYPPMSAQVILGKTVSGNMDTLKDWTSIQDSAILERSDNWVSNPIISNKKDGQMILRFYARNSSKPFTHRIWLTDNLHDECIGEILVTNEWQLFEIPVNTAPGAEIKLRIDHEERWQDLYIKNLQLSGISTGKELADKSNANNHSPFPKPENLTPLDMSGKPFTVYESQYYFYHAMKALERHAKERNLDLIVYVTPDGSIHRILPAIKQLQKENMKVIAYIPTSTYKTHGVDPSWYWSRGDSHWTEAAVRLTADEIIRLWKFKKHTNRQFSAKLMADYTQDFPNQKA